MAHSKKFKNESQDARRHDKQHVAHPDEDRSKQPAEKHPQVDKRK